MTSYWWASQTENWRTVIPEGTLWAGLSVSGVAVPARESLKALAVGDVVFHYGGGSIQAVSQVAASWSPALRPASYPKRRPEEPDEGWIVRLTLVQDDFAMAPEQAARLITHGAPGPFDRDGTPGRRYVSPLADDEGNSLLRELGFRVEPSPESLYGLPVYLPSEGTDATALGLRRLEQGALRAHLLAGRPVADCVFCGSKLPAKLLIAAHIAPRHLLDDDQRRSFDDIAVLACALGCDALFEWGYISVADDGLIVARDADPVPALKAAIERLTGRKCKGFNSATAPYFALRASRPQR